MEKDNSPEKAQPPEPGTGGANGPALAIETRQLVRQYGSLRAVDGVDLAVRRGEIYGFLGPNGAGKTTVIRVLVTLLAPTSGSIMVAGHDVVRQPDLVRSRIGVALQDAALDNKQTGRELLRLQGLLYGLGRKEADRRIDELADLVDIGDAMKRQIGTYSGGMKRRLDLAAALIHRPEVLFLDEPTTGLDPISRSRIWDEVREINGGMGVTVFLTTQYLEEADALAARVGIINTASWRHRVSFGAEEDRGADLIVARIGSETRGGRRHGSRGPFVHPLGCRHRNSWQRNHHQCDQWSGPDQRSGAAIERTGSDGAGIDPAHPDP